MFYHCLHAVKLVKSYRELNFLENYDNGFLVMSSSLWKMLNRQIIPQIHHKVLR